MLDGVAHRGMRRTAKVLEEAGKLLGSDRATRERLGALHVGEYEHEDTSLLRELQDLLCRLDVRCPVESRRTRPELTALRDDHTNLGRENAMQDVREDGSYRLQYDDDRVVLGGVDLLDKDVLRLRAGLGIVGLCLRQGVLVRGILPVILHPPAANQHGAGSPLVSQHLLEAGCRLVGIAEADDVYCILEDLRSSLEELLNGNSVQQDGDAVVGLHVGKLNHEELLGCRKIGMMRKRKDGSHRHFVEDSRDDAPVHSSPSELTQMIYCTVDLPESSILARSILIELSSTF